MNSEIKILFDIYLSQFYNLVRASNSCSRRRFNSLFLFILVPVSSMFRSNLALESRYFVMPSYAQHVAKS